MKSIQTKSNFKEKAKTLFSLFASALAAVYFIYDLTITNYAYVGWNLRFLTIWGLVAALITHLYCAFKRINKQTITLNTLINTSTLINVMVAFLYWRLYLIDPSLVNGDKTPVWIREYYLHALGPLLIVIEAVFLSSQFKPYLKSWLWSMVVCIAYSAWIELIIRPLSLMSPAWSKIPYPFLANLSGYKLVEFYIQTYITASIVFVILALLSIGIGKITTQIKSIKR